MELSVLNSTQLDTQLYLRWHRSYYYHWTIMLCVCIIVNVVFFGYYVPHQIRSNLRDFEIIVHSVLMYIDW